MSCANKSCDILVNFNFLVTRKWEKWGIEGKWENTKKWEKLEIWAKMGKMGKIGKNQIKQQLTVTCKCKRWHDRVNCNVVECH